MSEQNRNDVAVFIDFENVYVGVRDKLDANPNFEIIMERCNDLGRCILARAYADWYRYPRITSALYANNIEPMYVPTYYYDKDAGRTGRPIKNSADMNLCIDAMRTLFTMPAIKTFVLVTGDRDFIPLVHAIRQLGKNVVIIGVGGAASSHLAQSADEFIFYEHLIGKTITPPAAPAASRRFSDIDEYERPREQRAAAASKPARKTAEATPDDDAVYELLARAILEARVRNMAGIGSLQLLMKELSNGEFRVQNVRDAQGRPFEKFKDFITEAARRGKVVVSTDGAANEVFLPGEDARQLSRLVVTPEKAPDRKDKELTAPNVEPAADSTRGDSASKSRRRRRRNDYSDRETPQLDAPATPVAPEPLAPIVAPVTPVTPVVPPAPSDDSDAADSMIGDAVVSLPFSDEERSWVKAMVAASERPLSFQQIHDLLRDKRKRDDGIQRTNEELRSLIKLAINMGELQRIGRGNRVSYRVNPNQSTVTSPSAAIESMQPAVVTASIPSPQDLAVPTPSDDGLDAIATSTPSRAKRPKAKPATDQRAASTRTATAKPARKPAPAATEPTTPAHTRTSKQPIKPARKTPATQPAAPIPSPIEDAPVPTATPRRRKKRTE